jgi:predicted Zn finger-like uncharacterized protein
MLTRCPQCETTFRVSPQQLKVHQGEVRCGRCSTIFDAFDSLVAESPSATTGDVADNFPASAPAAVAAAAEPVTAVAATAGDASPPLQMRPDFRWAAPDFVPSSTKPPAAGRLSEKPEPRRRWPWVVLAVLAALALIGQTAYMYRIELAVNTAILLPESKPWLERVCAEWHCTMPLPRRVDLVSIDASDLQVDTGHANLMLLTATLKNRAPFTQEYPTLALTLTDTQEQALARRILTPADYLERKTDSRAGFTANADLAIKVFIDSRELKATGYRLFLFYP